MENHARQKPYVIGIAGSSGSGKTFFLNSLLSHFKPLEVTTISQDDYYMPCNAKTREENTAYNFDLPSSIDRDIFCRDLKSLIDGQTIEKKEYTFNNPALDPRMLQIKPAPIIIIEGLFILYYQEINELLDHRIFMYADEDIALQRRIKRDFIERGYHQDEVLYKWNNHVMPAYNQYLLPFKKSCDQVIENSSDDKDKIIQITKDISAYLRQAFF